MFISNIHDIVHHKQFKVYVKVINILAVICIGYPSQFAFNRPSSKTHIVLSKLIENELAESYLNVPYKAEIPYYVSCLFHRFLLSTKEVLFNCYNLDRHRLYHDGWFGYVYGWEKLQHIFKNDDGTCKLSMFFRLCRDLERLVIFSFVRNVGDWRTSVTLNEAFVEEILKCMDILDETANDTFTEFVVVNPIGSIKKFMRDNDARFQQSKYRMMQKSYTDPKRKGMVKNALYIQRL